MAQPIPLEIPPRNPRAELHSRLDQAPDEHGKAQPRIVTGVGGPSRGWRRGFEYGTSVPPPMRSSGLEPPRGKLPTRPSTLRVYQFRHERGRGWRV